jgi:hypothetical protein
MSCDEHAAGLGVQIDKVVWFIARKLESTVRYLGIEVDDALSISEQLDL